VLKVTVRGLSKLKRDLKAESKRQERAMRVAVKFEGFRLMRTMRSEVAKGSPGGKRFAPLSFLSRRWHERGTKRSRPDRPFLRTKSGHSIVRAIMYNLKFSPNFDMRVGFTGKNVSRSWKRIAKMQQEGFTHGMSDLARDYFRMVGGLLGKRNRIRRIMFIRKSTTTFRTPARPIVEPFWEAHKDEAKVNIRKNFRRKMKGERI